MLIEEISKYKIDKNSKKKLFQIDKKNLQKEEEINIRNINVK